MATKKDLVEAYSFSRRRLITAFVSGAPGGREVEPSRPGRTLIGGIALAVLLVAGAAVLGILKSPTTVDWDQAGVISDKDSGADYIITGPDQPLRQIANITSAMLLLGPDLERTDVSGEDIAEQDREGAIGILRAPTLPPPSDLLIQTGWTACTGTEDFTDRSVGTYGVKVDLDETPPTVPTPDVGYVLTTAVPGGGERTFLVAEATPPGGRGVPRAYAYPIPKGATKLSALLTETAGSTAQDALTVPQDYLELFTPGAPLALDTFGIAERDFGQRPDYADDESLAGKKVKIGDLIVSGDTTYLLTKDAGVVLDDFAQKVWANLDYPGKKISRVVPVDSSPGFTTSTLGFDGSVVWPAAAVQRKTEGEYCAQLDTEPGASPGARLVQTLGGDAASAAEVAPGEGDPEVEPGHGAVVTVGDWDAEGTGQDTLVDDSGTAFSLVGEARFRLGYDGVDEVVVPESWMHYFADGVALSVGAAECPPTSDPDGDTC